jgi:hypothetical protein
MRQARSAALALPDTTEQPHHEISSFRVRGNIFATIPDDDHLRVMAGEEEILAACAELPGACVPTYWGQQLACVEITLRAAPISLVRELLEEAWYRKAPAALQRLHPR